MCVLSYVCVCVYVYFVLSFHQNKVIVSLILPAEHLHT